MKLGRMFWRVGWSVLVVANVATAMTSASAENPTATNAPVGARRGDPARVGSVTTRRFSIQGMHCKDCAKGLAAELRLTPGVLRASVRFAEAEATVVCDGRRVALPALLKAIESAGFRGKPIESPSPGGVPGAPRNPEVAPPGVPPDTGRLPEGRAR